jgi:DNA-directed RNA polymerase subunit RPC12/RpoP
MTREFICADCRAHVFTFQRDQTDVCLDCGFIRQLALSPEREKELRTLLGCELEASHGVIREGDESPGRQDPDGD